MWYIIGTLVGLGLAYWINPLEMFRQRKQRLHVHRGDSWDGYTEHCRCGASASDRIGTHGLRCIQFEEWGQ
jgi:hypothetical protein